MEYQGIITGIGDLEQHINEITPDIDAKINDFLLSRNAIIEGFSIENGYLNGGILVFKGYRCKYAGEPISLSNSPNYINGIIRTDSNGNVYEFSLETSSAQGADTEIPTQPNSGACFVIFSKSGTSYFLVDNFKDNRLEDYHYPAKAYESDESSLLMSGGVISENATTPTALVNAHNAAPNRVANTEYVHNQIQAEIDAAEMNADIINPITGSSVRNFYGKRKAKLVLLQIQQGGFILDKNSLSTYQTTIPSSFYPKSPVMFIIADSRGRVGKCTLNTNGTITENDVTVSTILYNTDAIVIGYETN